MPFVTARDGAEIFYKDWGSGRPVVFSHGWPLNADAWDTQMQAIAAAGYRGVAHDRRGHGRSTQTSTGNDMDTYADDLAAVIEALDLRDATLVGHSTGGGEVVRYLARHGADRVRSAVLLGAVPPLRLQTEGNPDGVPIGVFDDFRASVIGDRAQFYKDLAVPFYGANRDGAVVSQGALDTFWLWSMQAGVAPAYDCIKAFSETDFTDDLAKIDIPVLVAHGDADQIVPFASSAPKTAEQLSQGRLKVYPGAPHGLTGAHDKEFTRDLLAYLAE